MSLTSISGETRNGVQIRRFGGKDVTIDELNLSNFFKHILLNSCWMNGRSIRQIKSGHVFNEMN